MKAKGRAYLVLAAIFGIVGIIQCIRWGMSDFRWAVAACMLNLLLMVPCIVAYALSRRTRRRIVQALLISSCLTTLVIWGSLTLAGEFLIAATTEVTSVRKYEKVLAEYWSFEPELVSHFPRPIPPDAQDVRFSFQPAFLQGGAHVQLRYSTTPDTIAELYQCYSARKTKSLQGGDRIDHVNMAGGALTTFFHTSGSKDGSFPTDYKIMVLDPIMTEEEMHRHWNHGQSHGVAISMQRNEIVYWAESW